MFQPRLTIGIPTLGARPDRLKKAVASALGGMAPARVVVADQSADGAGREALEQYADHPMVRVVSTHGHASCLWDNWCLVAEACDTEFFAWLQDDDVVFPHFGRRAITAFDRFPRAVVWLARLYVSHTEGLGNWWGGCGPMVPMDYGHGGAVEVRADVVIAGGYFSSFALSPGVAFRCTPEAIAAIRRVPKDADLFAERSVLAELCRLGPAACDPATVGYWVQHETNESKAQNAAGGAVKQYPAFARHLHSIVETRPGWEEALGGWITCVGPQHAQQWLLDTAPHEGVAATLDRAREIVAGVQGIDLPRLMDHWRKSEADRKAAEAAASSAKVQHDVTTADGVAYEAKAAPRRARKRAI